MARCRSVPALVALTPSTSAISALERLGVVLQRDQLAVARGRARPSARAHGVALGGELGRLVRARASAAGAGSSAVGGALAPAQLVQRGVAGDAEQPRARRAAAGVEAAAAPVGALERLRR